MIAARKWSDYLGVAASVGCAIHCAAMPFVIAFLPMLGLSFLADEGFHQVMVGVCLVFAASAFIPGWRRHRQLLPAGIAFAGLALISISAFALEDQCCTSCAVESVDAESAEVAELSLTGSVATDQLLITEQSSNTEQCTEACCPHCEAAAKTEESTEQTSVTSMQASLLGFSFLPWITPLGGLLLVSAHLTNYRLNCRCGCWPTDPAEATTMIGDQA